MDKGNPRGAETGPKVSCIIIFLDEERFLSEAIESVQAQTHGDWELLLVDDGSTDGSERIARSFVSRDPQRIRYFTHPERANRGMSASRNLGLQHARAPFIAFLDGDDVWLPDKLEHQLRIFERNPRADMVCGATVYWHSWDANAGQDDDQMVLVGTLQSGKAVPQDHLFEPPRLLRQLYPLGRGASPSTSGFMITRRLVDRVGGFVDQFTGLYEDQAFKIKVFRTAPVYVSSKTYDRYRQHAASTMAVGNVSGAREQARHRYLLWLEDHLRQAQPRCDAITRLQLARAFLPFRHARLHRRWMQAKQRWLR